MKKILAIFLVLFLLGCNEVVEEQQQQVTEQEVVIEQEEDFRDIYDEEIKALAESIVNLKPYEKDVYDCSDMTNELVIGLRNLGYKAEYVLGRKVTGTACVNIPYCNRDEDIECINNKCYALHAWTRLTIGNQVINIESTKGKVILNQFFMENYIG